MGEQACKISSLNSKYSLRYHRKSVAFWRERAKSCTRGIRALGAVFVSAVHMGGKFRTPYNGADRLRAPRIAVS